MKQTRVNFQVRRRDGASLTELGRRLGLALGCTFTPSQAEEFEGDEALESHVLGLWITLTVQLLDTTTTERLYLLVGDVAERDGEDWDDEATSMSSYIATLLNWRDQDGWYVPSIEELLADAGIMPTEDE